MKSGEKFYGIYSATVISNVDPMLQGRITVMVPDVGGVTPSTFVNPCVPMAGKQQGTFMVPQIGSTVWIQFEAGDPDKPVWMGGSWPDPALVPTAALIPVEPPGQTIVFQTSMQQLFMISDAPALPMLAPVPAPAPPGTGGIVLRSPTGAMIVVNDAGIFINNGKGATVELVANTVMINKVALVVV
jgi:Type VI secretion system/phage-baseplate injector OB domain